MKNLKHIIENHTSSEIGVATSTSWISRDIKNRSIKKEIIGEDLSVCGELVVSGSVIAVIASALVPKISIITWMIPILGLIGVAVLGIKSIFRQK